MIVIPQSAAKILLEAALDGLVSTREVHLYQNDYAPTPSTALANLTEATYSGYAAQAITPGTWPVYYQGSAQVVAVGTGLVFTPSGSGVSNIVYGYYITDTTGTRLIWAERFAEAKVMNGVTTGFTLIPAIGGQSAAG